MPDLMLPRGAYHRANGNFPPFELVNLFLEQTAAARGGVSFLSFPGLASTATRGTGPINGIFRQDDLFSGATFTVSGSTLYKDGTSLGTINGSGPVWFAASDIELVVGRGQSAYSYNGTTLAAISFPDGANVTWGTFLAGLFVFARAGSRKFYWSAVYDARTIDGSDFASAESSASYLVQVLAIGDVLYLGCKDKIEAWYPTGDGTLPFQRITQRTAKKGVAASGAMVELDNALHFVGDDRTVYRMAEVPERISDHGIEEQLAASATFSCFTFLHQGHAFLIVRTDTKSLGFDALTTGWLERRSWGLTNWRAQCATGKADGTPMFGSATTNDIFEHSGWQDAGQPHAREFTGVVPSTSAFPLFKVEIEANTGSAPITVPDPEIEMCFSRDGGNTFSAFRPAKLGATGKYRARPRWRRLGSFDAPGALLHFRVTDPVPFRVSSALSNESSAGRARE